MRLAVLLALTAICGVTVYRRLARESMRKPNPKADDRLSPRWVVQHAYDRSGDES